MPGLTLFRASSAHAVQHYVDTPADSTQLARDYYLGPDAVGPVGYVVRDGSGALVGERQGLTREEYRNWVDWVDPVTSEVKGHPRAGRSDGESKRPSGSPLFVEKLITCPKSLSMVGALYDDVDEALARAQADAADAVTEYFAQNAYVRIGQRGAQQLVKADRISAAQVRHMTSRDGDPHPHLHVQVSTRAWVSAETLAAHGIEVDGDGAWYGLWTAIPMRQHAEINGIVNSTILNHPAVHEALAKHGAHIDSASGEVAGITQEQRERFSKRHMAIKAEAKRLEGVWRTNHPGQEPSAYLLKIWDNQAWRNTRPPKESSETPEELKARWHEELADAGVVSSMKTSGASPARAVDSFTSVERESLAADAVLSVGAKRSTWSAADLAGQVRANLAGRVKFNNRAELDDLVADITSRAVDHCDNVLLGSDQQLAEKAAVRALTSQEVRQTEIALGATFANCAAAPIHGLNLDAAAQVIAADKALDDSQRHAATALAGQEGLVVVEGAAGAGKTRMLAAAVQASQAAGGRLVVVAPSAKAAIIAGKETATDASTVHGLLFAHGYRWNDKAQFTRLNFGDLDPTTGRIWQGVAKNAPVLDSRTRVVVDEAGMIDQPTMTALLDLAAQHGAVIGLVGDRAQLGAVGRGGVLHIGATVTPAIDMTDLHRFADKDYAAITLQLRDRDKNAVTALRQRGLIIHPENENDSGPIKAAQEVKTTAAELAAQKAAELMLAEPNPAQASVMVVCSTNGKAATINELIAAQLRQADIIEQIPDHAIAGADGLKASIGARVQTRENNTQLGVFNRDVWTVTRIDNHGGLHLRDHETGRTAHLPADYVKEHTHLAWATTEYGAQGVTANHALTVIDEETTGSGTYVGLSRGKQTNLAVVEAVTDFDADEILRESLQRENADTGLAAATEQAQQAINGLVEPEPITEPSWLTSWLQEQHQGVEQTKQAAIEQAAARNAERMAIVQQSREEKAQQIQASRADLARTLAEYQQAQTQVSEANGRIKQIREMQEEQLTAPTAELVRTKAELGQAIGQTPPEQPEQMRRPLGGAKRVAYDAWHSAYNRLQETQKATDAIVAPHLAEAETARQQALTQLQPKAEKLAHALNADAALDRKRAQDLGQPREVGSATKWCYGRNPDHEYRRFTFTTVEQEQQYWQEQPKIWAFKPSGGYSQGTWVDDDPVATTRTRLDWYNQEANAILSGRRDYELDTHIDPRAADREHQIAVEHAQARADLGHAELTVIEILEPRNEAELHTAQQIASDLVAVAQEDQRRRTQFDGKPVTIATTIEVIEARKAIGEDPAVTAVTWIEASKQEWQESDARARANRPRPNFDHNPGAWAKTPTYNSPDF